MDLPHQKSPCKNCPFRKDSFKGWLGKERIKGILEEKSFVCHKRNDLQCAGHMVVKGSKNAFVKLAKDIGIDLEIKNRELIFAQESDLIKHHSNG